jgi:hypothetical protein
MPTLSKNFTLTITPEQFLENCSDLELKELDLLIQMPRYSHRIVQLQELERQGKPLSHNSNQNQVDDCKNNNPTTKD